MEEAKRTYKSDLVNKFKDKSNNGDSLPAVMTHNDSMYKFRQRQIVFSISLYY